MRELWPFLRLYRRHVPLLSAGLLLTLFTLLAGIGLLTLSGWFLSAAAVAGLALNTRQDFNYMLPAGAVRFLSIVRTASRWGDRVVSHDATFRLLTLLRVRFWQRLAPLPHSAVQRFRQADLLNRLVADIEAMDHIYLRLITPLLTGVLAIAAMTLFLWRIDTSLALPLLICLVSTALLLPWLLYRLGRRPGQQLTRQRARLRTQCVSYVENQAELLLFNAADWQRDQLLAEEQALLDSQRQMSQLAGLSTLLLTVCSGGLVLLMLWLAGNGVGGLPPDPRIALVVFLALSAFEAITPLAGAFQHLGASLNSARRLNEVLLDATPLTFGEAERTDPTQPPELVFSDLHFAYLTDQPVLQGLNLRIAPGEKVALLGPTGCGKSTLLQLLLREWQPQGGTISVDGLALDTLSETSLRQTFAVVSQRVPVFSATLADNLRIAAPEASNETLCAVLHTVGLQTLLGDDPDAGLRSWLGEGGRPLSGGEQRRLGLARALLYPAPVLVLDEATEGLDPQTEAAILDCLLAHAAGRSLLMITHRPGGLPQMDRIALLEQGRIRQCAAHQTLLADDDSYRRWFARLQG